MNMTYYPPGTIGYWYDPNDIADYPTKVKVIEFNLTTGTYKVKLLESILNPGNPPEPNVHPAYSVDYEFFFATLEEISLRVLARI